MLPFLSDLQVFEVCKIVLAPLHPLIVYFPPKLKDLPTCSQRNQGKKRWSGRDEVDSQNPAELGDETKVSERAYGVIGLRALAVKIKQVCSVTTRGGERENRNGGETEERETEGGRGPTHRSSQGWNNWWRTVHTACSKTAGNGERRKKRRECRKWNEGTESEMKWG